MQHNHRHPALAILAGVVACAHGRLQEVPLLVSSDVLVDDPAAFPRAQALRGALVSALREEGYCLDRNGDFEGMLELRAATYGDALIVVLTLDTAAGSRVEEVEGSFRGPVLPDLKQLLRELADSAQVRDFADDAAGRQTECRFR